MADEKQGAMNFVEVFSTLLDKHRDRLAMYLADDAVLDWFGRTVTGRDSITGFMNLEVPETQHNLTSVEPSGPFQHRKVSVEKTDDITITELKDDDSDDELAKPLGNCDFTNISLSNTHDVISKININKLSLKENDFEHDTVDAVEPWESRFTTPENCEIPGQYKMPNMKKAKEIVLFKPNTTPSTKANKFLEARGSIQFQRTKQPPKVPKNMKLVSDTMKWRRFCKLQIAYSASNNAFQNLDRGDGLAEDFKIWLLVYQDNTRCRRNLAEAFDKVK